MTAWRRPAGATALAVALVACRADAPATPPSEATRALGLAFELPAGFEPGPTGNDERPRDAEAFWVGPPGADGTAVGITVARLCDGPLPTWGQVRAEAEAGRHTAWSDYRLAAPPDDVDVDGASEALRVRGTYELRREGDDEEVELVHDELIVLNDDVLHRLRVEGASTNVASLPIEDLFASVQVVSTACPV